VKRDGAEEQRRGERRRRSGKEAIKQQFEQQKEALEEWAKECKGGQGARGPTVMRAAGTR